MEFKPIVNFPGLGDVERGEKILVGYKSEVRTAYINRFFNPDGDAWHEVDAAIIVGADRGGGNPQEVFEYAGEGVAFRHVNDPHPSGNRFCLPREGEAGCLKVWEAMNAAANPPAPPVEQVVDESSADTADLPEPKEQAQQEFDPADANKDGIVTPKEQKRHDKQNQ